MPITSKYYYCFFCCFYYFYYCYCDHYLLIIPASNSCYCSTTITGAAVPSSDRGLQCWDTTEEEDWPISSCTSSDSHQEELQENLKSTRKNLEIQGVMHFYFLHNNRIWSSLIGWFSGKAFWDLLFYVIKFFYDLSLINSSSNHNIIRMYEEEPCVSLQDSIVFRCTYSCAVIVKFTEIVTNWWNLCFVNMILVKFNKMCFTEVRSVSVVWFCYFPPSKREHSQIFILCLKRV